jgi:elongation factor Ts
MKKSISPSMEDIKKLRETTLAGVMDCRQALLECVGDMKKAEEWLRKKGLQKADKKADRQVKAGMVFSYVHHTGRIGCMVALACETDFVAKTEEFQKLGRELAIQAAGTQPENIEAFIDEDYLREPGKKISELIKETIGKLGENIQVLEVKIVRI